MRLVQDTRHYPKRHERNGHTIANRADGTRVVPFAVIQEVLR